MFKPSYLIRLPLLVLFCLLCQRAVFAQDIDSSTVELICSTKSEPFGFTSPRQVKNLIEQFRNDKSKCPEEYHESFESLDRVLDDEILSDVCGPLVYGRIKEFHTRYISIYTPESTREELEEANKKGSTVLRPIPESLRRFFILFVMQMNGACKRNLVHRLDSDVEELVTDEDFELLKQMKNEGSRLMGDEYREQAKRMKDLTIMDRNQEGDGSKLYVQVRFGDVIKKAKDACDNKFRPIYEELYLPVIQLIKLGYNDNLNTDKENELLDYDKKYKRWFGIIEACEILKDIEVLQDSSSLAAVADLIQANSLVYVNKKDLARSRADFKKIRVLSEEEATELKANIAKNIELHNSISVYEVQKVDFGHQKLNFTPRMWLLEDYERKSEVKNFERQVKGFIHDKTSFFHLKRKALSLLLKQKFHKSKLQVQNRDENSALGRIAYFMDQHQAGIRLACAIIGLTVIMAVHFG